MQQLTCTGMYRMIGWARAFGTCQCHSQWRYLPATKDEVNVYCDCPPCLPVCLSVSKIPQKRVHGLGWNLADVETWTNWSTFEPDLDRSLGCLIWKSESRRFVKVGQTGTSRRAGCRSWDALQREILFTPCCSQGPVSFPGLVDFSVRHTVAEIRGVKLAQFSDFGLCQGYMRSAECPSSWAVLLHKLGVCQVLGQWNWSITSLTGTFCWTTELNENWNCMSMVVWRYDFKESIVGISHQRNSGYKTEQVKYHGTRTLQFTSLALVHASVWGGLWPGCRQADWRSPLREKRLRSIYTLHIHRQASLMVTLYTTFVFNPWGCTLS